MAAIIHPSATRTGSGVPRRHGPPLTGPRLVALPGGAAAASARPARASGRRLRLAAAAVGALLGAVLTVAACWALLQVWAPTPPPPPPSRYVSQVDG